MKRIFLALFLVLSVAFAPTVSHGTGAPRTLVDEANAIVGTASNSLSISQYDSKGVEVVQLNSAFGEQVIVELHPQWQQSFEYTVGNTDLNTNTVSNGGTVTQANGMAIVSSSTTTASEAELASTHHAKYKAGFGGIVRFSYMYDTPVAGTYQYVGLMDEHSGIGAEFLNGYAIGFNGLTATVSRFQNDTLFEVTQANWDDPLDGSGASGVTIDFEKLNVYYIQFQYLGAGNIYFWVEHPVTGVPFRFHTIQYANKFTSPSVHNPNFHFTMYVDNGGTTSDMTGSCGSYGYFIEGKTELIEVHQPQFSSETISKAGVTTEIALFTIRNKSTYPTVASKTNYIDLILERFGVSNEASSANNQATARLVKNTTLGGTPAYSDINATNSIVDIDVAGTTVTGGVEIISFQLAGKNDRANENLLNLKFIIHPGETVTLAVSSVNSATFRGSILWKDLF